MFSFYVCFLLKYFSIPDSIIFAEDNNGVIREVEEGGDGEEEQPEPENVEYLLSDDVAVQHAEIVCCLDPTTCSKLSPLAHCQAGEHLLHEPSSSLILLEWPRVASNAPKIAVEEGVEIYDAHDTVQKIQEKAQNIAKSIFL